METILKKNNKIEEPKKINNFHSNKVTRAKGGLLPVSPSKPLVNNAIVANPSNDPVPARPLDVQPVQIVVNAEVAEDLVGKHKMPKMLVAPTDFGKTDIKKKKNGKTQPPNAN